MKFRWHMFKHWLSVRFEKFVMSVAWLMPRRLAYMCAIRVISHATTGKYETQNVPELSAMDALQRWTK